MNPDLQTLQSQERAVEKADGPQESRASFDAREVLTRVLYETLSGRVCDELQWALG